MDFEGLGERFKLAELEHFNVDAVEHQREQFEHLMEQQHDMLEHSREAVEKFRLLSPDTPATPQPKRAPRNK